jgi:lipopolysaccharide/colanic/teichoic acid biosynthesis glycosyltransferase
MENSTATHPRHRSQLGSRRREDSAARPSRTKQRGYREAIKRVTDLLVSLFLIVLLSPIMLVVAIAVRLDSRGPVLFRQRRLGRDMEPFTVLKFRTMADNSSPELHQRYIAELAGTRLGGAASNGHSNGNGNSPANGRANGGAAEIKKLTADPRVTGVGRFLRRVSLDELPQLFNVLGGTMSLIGPRPALEYELEHYSPDHYKRFDVRPGITGLWQVSGRNQLGFKEMLDLDVKYSEEATLITDVGIILRTPLAAVRDAA